MATLPTPLDTEIPSISDASQTVPYVPTTTESVWDLQILPNILTQTISPAGSFSIIEIPVELPSSSTLGVGDYGYVLLVDDVPTNLTLFISLDAMGLPDPKKGILTATIRRNPPPGKLVVTILTKKSPKP